MFKGYRYAENPPGQFEVTSPSTNSRTTELPIFGHLTIKADKIATPVKLDTRANRGLSERQKATKKR
jgi:hypothetical protein